MKEFRIVQSGKGMKKELHLLEGLFDGLSQIFSKFNILKYIWVGPLLTASFTEFLRYASGAHFSADVLAGAVVGSAVGYFIPHLHRTAINKSTLFPNISQGNGFKVNYTYKFWINL
jgi:membrane-associated phospholipid phosphatase